MITFLLIVIVVELGLLLKSFNEVSEEVSEDLVIIKKTLMTHHEVVSRNLVDVHPNSLSR